MADRSRASGLSDSRIIMGALGLWAVAVVLVWLWGGPLIGMVIGIPVGFIVALVRILIGIRPRE